MKRKQTAILMPEAFLMKREYLNRKIHGKHSKSKNEVSVTNYFTAIRKIPLTFKF